ncbi:MAG: hypothetical protein O3C48_08540 [Crenarchaeota archaeon]|nr:hypothetical protein [Thermoproteota archaeon]
MINSRRNGKEDLFQEIKWRSRCKLLQFDPSHTCTFREYQENLHLSNRDVKKYLKELLNEGRIKLDKIQSPKFKRLPRKRYVYTVIDRRFFESENEIYAMWHIINLHLDRMRKIGTKMRDRPAMTMKMLLQIPNLSQEPKWAQNYWQKYQGKYDKLGHEYLEDFCTIVNEIFSYIDSMTYASLSNVLDSDEKTVKVIEEIRTKTMKEVTDVMEYIFKPYEKNLRKACYDIMLMRIPTYFMLGELERRSKVRT